MPRLVVIPASGKAANDNLELTMREPVSLARIRPLLDRKTAAILEEERGTLHAWGLAPGRFNTLYWKRMERGDLCIFFGGKDFVLAGRIIAKVRNASLPKELWKSRPGGNPWELVFFLTDVNEISVPLDKFIDDVGFGPGYIPRKTMVLRQERLDRLYGKYKTVEGAFGLAGTPLEGKWLFFHATPANFTELIKELRDRLSEAEHELRICNPYFDDSTFEMFLERVPKETSIQMVVTADPSIKSKIERHRVTNSMISDFADHRIVETRLALDLHSRFFVSDKKMVVLLSADLQKDQYTDKYQYMLVTRESQLVEDCISFFDEIWKHATPCKLTDLTK